VKIVSYGDRWLVFQNVFFDGIELFRHINRPWLKRKAVVINSESDNVKAEFFLANFCVTSPSLSSGLRCSVAYTTFVRKSIPWLLFMFMGF